VEGVVGRVRQIDPEAHPYSSHLLLVPPGKPGLAPRSACRSGRRARVRRNLVGVPGRSLGMDPAFDILALVIPTELSVEVVDQDSLDEVVASCRRVLILGVALDWSTRSEAAGTPGSLDRHISS
jgi:hypothetical protein